MKGLIILCTLLTMNLALKCVYDVNQYGYELTKQRRIYTCPSGDNHCVTFRYELNGSHGTKRECGFCPRSGNGQTIPATVTELKGQKVRLMGRMDCCDRDGCNSAKTIVFPDANHLAWIHTDKQIRLNCSGCHFCEKLAIEWDDGSKRAEWGCGCHNKDWIHTCTAEGKKLMRREKTILVELHCSTATATMKFWVILFCLLALYRADNSTPDPNDPNDEEDTEVHLTCINDQNQRGEMHTGDTEYQNQADCGKFSVCKYCAKWHGKNKDGTDLSYWGCGCGTDNNLPFLMMGENCTVGLMTIDFKESHCQLSRLP
ncbi:unnamed protein product, partial [Mesorhabditis belari]|uniref:Uncharacterized protein n=1 Tax=Mesorhabditis belari TaxID=2138241 RepID=A0AAF3J618_9BILA